MKLEDIQVGRRYVANVSGKMVVVRVTQVREAAPAFGNDRWRTLIDAVSEVTGSGQNVAEQGRPDESKDLTSLGDAEAVTR